MLIQNEPNSSYPKASVDFDSSTSSSSSISIDYSLICEEKNYFNEESNGKISFIDLIPHFSDVLPNHYQNYSTFAAINSNDLKPQHCSSPIKSQIGSAINQKKIIEQSNSKLDELIDLIQDIHRQSKRNKCSYKHTDNSNVASLEPLPDISESSDSDIESAFSKLVLKKSKSVMDTAKELNRIRLDLNKRDVRIKENLKNLRTKIKTYKTQFAQVNTHRDDPTHHRSSAQLNESAETLATSDDTNELSINIILRSEASATSDKSAMPYEYDYVNYDTLKDGNNEKKIRFIYGTDKSMEDYALSSNLKAKDKLQNRSSSNNRVKFNDIIEFYDPSLQNRANYSTEEFALLKANPNLVIKHNNNNPTNFVSWSDIATRPKDDQFIPIELEKIEANARQNQDTKPKFPMVQFLFEEKIQEPTSKPQTEPPMYSSIYQKRQTTTPTPIEPNNRVVSPLKVKYPNESFNSTNKIDLNNYYDEINESIHSKYDEKYPQHYSMPLKITRNSKATSEDNKYQTLPRPDNPKPIGNSFANENIYQDCSKTPFNYQHYPNEKLERKYNAVKPEITEVANYDIKKCNTDTPTLKNEINERKTNRPAKIIGDDNSSVAYTISNSPLKPFRSRGVVKIKTNKNLYSFQPNNDLKPAVTTKQIDPAITSTVRNIPVEHASNNKPKPLTAKQQTIDEFLNNKNLIINSGAKTPQIKTAEIKTQDYSNKAESVAEFLTKSKVFNQQTKQVLYDINDQINQTDLRVQRRSSRIGEEQNEKELNSIFKRIYNRHRYSLSGMESAKKNVSIRRFSNSNNLSSF